MDFTSALSDSPDWDVEVNEKRARPPGAASDSHHVEDVVLADAPSLLTNFRVGNSAVRSGSDASQCPFGLDTFRADA